MIPRYHPQIGIWDVLRALYPTTINHTQHLPGFGNKIESDSIFLLNSATAGLTIILKALGLPENSTVAGPV